MSGLKKSFGSFSVQNEKDSQQVTFHKKPSHSSGHDRPPPVVTDDSTRQRSTSRPQRQKTDHKPRQMVSQFESKHAAFRKSYQPLATGKKTFLTSSNFKTQQSAAESEDGRAATDSRHLQEFTDTEPQPLTVHLMTSHTEMQKDHDEVDEQTRLARFESMKKAAPGSRAAKASRNKKLFVVHKDLQKQCDKLVKRHEYDAQVKSLELKRQQTFYEQKQESLKQQKVKLDEESVRTRRALDRIARNHRLCEAQSRNKLETPARTSDMEIIRAIRRMSMPKTMKEKLQLQTYTTRISED